VRALTLDDFMPFGDDGNLVVVRGWRTYELMYANIVQRLQRELEPTESEYGASDFADALTGISSTHVHGWARFWLPDESGCPYGTEGGVKLSKHWKPGYVRATWVYEHY